MEDAEPRRSSGLRLTVLVIAGVEALLLVVFAFVALGSATSSEELSRNIASGMLTLAGGIALPVLVALFLAYKNRWLWLALALCLAVLAAPIALFPYL